MTLEVDLLYGKSIVGNTYSGVSFKNHHNKFSTFMTTKVKQKYFDIEGTSEIIEGFDDILSAGFSRENLEKVFTSNKEVTDWKVGESFAECYLEENPDIRIHYDFSRDLKNPNSSPAGIDLIGFTNVYNSTVFLLGEIKTSYDQKKKMGCKGKKAGGYSHRISQQNDHLWRTISRR